MDIYIKLFPELQNIVIKHILLLAENEIKELDSQCKHIGPLDIPISKCNRRLILNTIHEYLIMMINAKENNLLSNIIDNTINSHVNYSIDYRKYLEIAVEMNTDEVYEHLFSL